MSDDKTDPLPRRTCPTCGRDTLSVDDLFCESGCGTMLTAPSRPESLAQRNRRLRAPWSSEDRETEEGLDYLRSVGTLRLIAEAMTGPASAGAKTKRGKVADARAAKAHRLRDSGMTYAAIATALDCDPSTVPRLLKRPI